MNNSAIVCASDLSTLIPGQYDTTYNRQWKLLKILKDHASTKTKVYALTNRIALIAGIGTVLFGPIFLGLHMAGRAQTSAQILTYVGLGFATPCIAIPLIIRTIDNKEHDPHFPA